VRGIIGDRVMVLFNPSTAHTDAVNTEILMNTICKNVLNERFKQNEVTFGIGIDYGRMLATKTGVRRHGYERHNYRSLVWLGRPANVASKLTDLANKTTHHSREIVREARITSAPSLGLGNALLPGYRAQNTLAMAFSSPSPSMVDHWVWEDVELKEFVGRLRLSYGPAAPTMTHLDLWTLVFVVSFYQPKNGLTQRRQF
jgi:hypothetical protein